MNSLSSAFAGLYLGCAVIASVAVLMRLSRHLSSGGRWFSAALVCPLIIVYLAGMHRSAGIDFATYADAYYEQGQAIPDLGYTALTWLTRRMGIDFGTFLLCQGVFTLTALWVAAKAHRADPVVVLVVYLLHLAIVRDMSQSRIGLAVAIFLIGQTRERTIPRALLYVCAMSMHVTVVVLMFVWTCARLSSRLGGKQQLLLVYLPLAVFALSGGVLLQLASWVDPRIEIYLAWDDVAYGAPLESYGALVRTLLVIAVYAAASRRFKDLPLRNYVVMELAGAAILLGFSQFSIFAARLSNVAISMYPIGLGIVALAYRARALKPRAAGYGALIHLSVIATMATLLVRPGSLDALQQVVPTFFELVAR